MTKNINWKKWITLIICGVAGSVIYKLPYIWETYYTALQDATGASKEQLGFLMSMYGLVNFILYLPGGWAADKFSARKLMTFSLVSTGLTGFYFATMPSYHMLLILFGFWGITTVFTFWSVCVRIVRSLGESKEQGRLYGYWFLGKGATSIVLGLISVPIFSHFDSGRGGLTAAIVFYSVITLFVGVLCWFVLDDEKKTGEQSSFKLSDMGRVLKMPTIWLAGIVTFCMWNIYIGFGLVTPYLKEVFHMSEANAAIAGIVRAYVLFAFGGLVGGQIADRCASRTRFMIYAFMGMIVFTISYLYIPGEVGNLKLALANMIALGVFLYCANAVFFSIIDEVKVPLYLTGTAAGVISLMTYLPEIYAYSLTGRLVDNGGANSAQGYHNVFIYMVVHALIGLIAAFILQYMNKKIKAKNANTDNKTEINSAAEVA